MIKPYNILFLSSGSACRSQIARGWSNWYGRPVYDIDSASLTASGIDDYAITVMKEIGIDISDQQSQIISDDMIRAADIVVTLCTVADEQCPDLPTGVNKELWSLESPVISDSTSEHERLQTYRLLRDDIKARVIDLIARLNKKQYENFQPFPGTAAVEHAHTAAI